MQFAWRIANVKPLASFVQRTRLGLSNCYAENYIKVNPYFGGQTFSSADIMMEFVATYIKSMPFDPATYPKLAEWQAKVQQRPAYLRAMKVGAPDGLDKYRPKPKPAA